MHCVNVSSLEFKDLHLAVGGSIASLAADVSLWQEQNGLDKFPTKEEIINYNSDNNTNNFDKYDDPLLKELLKKTSGIKISINNSVKETTYNSWSGEIIINPDLIKEGKELEVVKHELVHALTVGQYFENQEFQNKLKKVFDLAKSKLFDKYETYFKNDLEFLAYATTNVEFMNDLNKIIIKSNAKKITLKDTEIQSSNTVEDLINITSTKLNEMIILEHFNRHCDVACTIYSNRFTNFDCI